MHFVPTNLMLVLLASIATAQYYQYGFNSYWQPSPQDYFRSSGSLSKPSINNPIANPQQDPRFFFSTLKVTIATSTSTSTVTTTTVCTTSTTTLKSCTPSGRRRRGMSVGGKEGRGLFYDDQEEEGEDGNIFLPSKYGNESIKFVTLQTNSFFSHSGLKSLKLR